MVTDKIVNLLIFIVFNIVSKNNKIKIKVLVTILSK